MSPFLLVYVTRFSFSRFLLHYFLYALNLGTALVTNASTTTDCFGNCRQSSKPNTATFLALEQQQFVRLLFQPCDCWTWTFILIVTPFNTNTCCVMVKCVTCCSSSSSSSTVKMFLLPLSGCFVRRPSECRLATSSAKNYTVAHNR